MFNLNNIIWNNVQLDYKPVCEHLPLEQLYVKVQCANSKYNKPVEFPHRNRIDFKWTRILLFT